MRQLFRCNAHNNNVIQGIGILSDCIFLSLFKVYMFSVMYVTHYDCIMDRSRLL